MSTENVTPKNSPFMSMFGRKKRGVNGTKSADDIRGTAAALAINNGQTPTMLTGNGDSIAGGYIDSDVLEPLPQPQPQSQPQPSSRKEIPYISNGGTHRTSTGGLQRPSEGFAGGGSNAAAAAARNHYPSVAPSNSTPSTFAEKIRLHRSSRAKHSRDAENGGTSRGGAPTQASTLPSRSAAAAAGGDKKRSGQLGTQQKAWSADAVYMNSEANYLMEALETLGEEPPIVARSIPKHAVVDTSKFKQRSLDNCLFDASVYDGMLYESLKVCELLQNHLTACIVTVRAKSPDARRLESLNEETEEDEEESEASGAGDGSQQTVIESSKRRSGNADPNRLSTLTNDTTASSIDSRRNSLLQPPTGEGRRLKSVVQYQC